MKKHITVTVCDICFEDGRHTSKVTVGGELGRGVFDLCDEHAKPIKFLFDKRLKRVKPTRKKPPTKVVDLDATA